MPQSLLFFPLISLAHWSLSAFINSLLWFENESIIVIKVCKFKTLIALISCLKSCPSATVSKAGQYNSPHEKPKIFRTVTLFTHRTRNFCVCHSIFVKLSNLSTHSSCLAFEECCWIYECTCDLLSIVGQLLRFPDCQTPVLLLLNLWLTKFWVLIKHPVFMLTQISCIINHWDAVRLSSTCWAFLSHCFFFLNWILFFQFFNLQLIFECLYTTL